MAVQSIERTFTILRTIAQHPTGISVTALAEQTKLHKSTVSRLVISLEAERAVERDNGSLRIGNGIAALVASSIHSSTLKTLAYPFLQQLSDTTNETAGLCVPDGDMAYYIDQVSSERTVQIRDWTGDRMPLYAVSSGKLFLALAGEKRVEEYLAHSTLTQYTPNTIIDPDHLRERLSLIRDQGYDWAFEEFSEGLVVVSGPIYDHHRQLIASIYLCGPSFRFPPAGQQDRMTQLVVEACQQLTNLICEQD
ncbi:IclR family transcriptional regulator [Chloroflexi bacterium TSY]|nr:IclR family transcriptional regulator [Chloroflexi bacterium TSY]